MVRGWLREWWRYLDLGGLGWEERKRNGQFWVVRPLGTGRFALQRWDEGTEGTTRQPANRKGVFANSARISREIARMLPAPRATYVAELSRSRRPKGGTSARTLAAPSPIDRPPANVPARTRPEPAREIILRSSARSKIVVDCWGRRRYCGCVEGGMVLRRKTKDTDP